MLLRSACRLPDAWRSCFYCQVDLIDVAAVPTYTAHFFRPASREFNLQVTCAPHVGPVTADGSLAVLTAEVNAQRSDDEWSF